MSNVVFGVGSPGSSQTASGGKVYAFNNIGNVTSVALLGISGERRSVTFHNPGSNDVLVYPQTTATGTVNAPTIANPGGGFRVFGNGGSLTVSGECQQSWSALSFSGTNQPLTVMTTHV